MVAILLGADNGFFYAGQIMHFSSPFTVFLIYHKHSTNPFILPKHDRIMIIAILQLLHKLTVTFF